MNKYIITIAALFISTSVNAKTVDPKFYETDYGNGSSIVVFNDKNHTPPVTFSTDTKMIVPFSEGSKHVSISFLMPISSDEEYPIITYEGETEANGDVDISFVYISVPGKETKKIPTLKGSKCKSSKELSMCSVKTINDEHGDNINIGSILHVKDESI